jgi:hypothetical protein
MDDICLRITGDASGASGPMEWNARLDSAAAKLVDFVDEQLVDRGILYDSGDLDAIRRMVAVAMLRQHDYDVELWQGVLDDIRPHDAGGMVAT